MVFLERPLKNNAVEGRAARQRHVHLPVGKGAPPHVDHHVFKGFSLALVNGDGKGQAHRILPERSDLLRAQLFVFQEKPVDFPGVGGNARRISVVQFGHNHLLAVVLLLEPSNFADGAVHPLAQ